MRRTQRLYCLALFTHESASARGVLTTEGPLLLLAGAGSGKTTVLIHRIANLIRYGCASDSTEVPPDAVPEDIDFLEEQTKYPTEEGVQRADALCALRPAAPWSILAITFTNKAANELRERLTDLLGPEANDVWAMTFHSACCRILRREIERLGYDRSFTIYDTADSERVMKDLLRERGLDEKTFPPRAVLAQISRLKDQMQTPEEFLASVNSDYRLKCIGQLYASYQRRLQEANAVDFDDIILLTVRLLQEYEDVRDHYQRKFRYVLIDEYQDTNHLQYLLASLLAGRHENICVVGDDDQSIYRFRGATIENILNFENEYQARASSGWSRTTARRSAFWMRPTPSLPTTTAARARSYGRRTGRGTVCASMRPLTAWRRPTTSQTAS